MFSSPERGAALALGGGVREAGVRQELPVSFLISFRFTAADTPESFFPFPSLGDISRDINTHLPPGVEALDRPVVSTFCKEVGFTDGLTAGCITASWDGSPSCVQNILCHSGRPDLNKASHVPRPCWAT